MEMFGGVPGQIMPRLIADNLKSCGTWGVAGCGAPMNTVEALDNVLGMSFGMLMGHN